MFGSIKFEKNLREIKYRRKIEENKILRKVKIELNLTFYFYLLLSAHFILFNLSI